MAIQLPALAGNQPDFSTQFGLGMNQGQAYRTNEVALKDAEDARRKNGLTFLVNASTKIQTPQDFEQFKKVALTIDPEAADAINAATFEDLPRIRAGLTSLADQQKMEIADRTADANIGLIGAKTNYVGAQTQDIGVDNRRADWKTGAEVANIGSEMGVREGQYGASAGGQLPKGWTMGPGGKAIPIPGYVAPASSGSGVVVGPDGTLSVQPGGGKLTEAQSKQLYFLNRTESTGKKLDAVDAALADVGDAATTYLPNIVGNQFRSKEYQMADQIADEWIAGVLRLESGAAIPKDELARYRQTYFPQPGDDQSVIERKREARRTVAESMRIGLGSLADQIPEGGMPLGAPEGDDDIDALLGKYQ